jgi:hypothetical protein
MDRSTNGTASVAATPPGFGAVNCIVGRRASLVQIAKITRS